MWRFITNFGVRVFPFFMLSPSCVFAAAILTLNVAAAASMSRISSASVIASEVTTHINNTADNTR